MTVTTTVETPAVTPEAATAAQTLFLAKSANKGVQASYGFVYFSLYLLISVFALFGALKFIEDRKKAKLQETEGLDNYVLLQA